MADQDSGKPVITSSDADRAYLVVLTALIAELKHCGSVNGAVLAESIQRFATAIKNPDPGFNQLVTHFINHARAGTEADSDEK